MKRIRAVLRLMEKSAEEISVFFLTVREVMFVHCF
jgi:hypothetical protein